MATSKINNEVIILLLLSQILPMLGHAGNILLYTIIVILYIHQRRKVVLWKTRLFLIPLFISFFIGLFIQRFEIYTIFRDVFYLISPIMILMFGEVLSSKIPPRKFMRVVVVIGVAWSVVFCLTNLVKNGMAMITDPRQVRDSQELVLSINTFILISAALLFSDLLYGKETFVSKERLCLFLNILAVYFSGSRTILLALFVVFLLIGYPKVKQHKKLVVPIIIFVGILYLYVQVSESGYATGFLKAGTEITSANFDRAEDVTNNYRAYEAFVAFSQISEAPLYQQILGKGMGSYVDLRGLPDPLNQEILPILHNGYPFMILKMGYWGLLLFLGVFIKLLLYFWKRKMIPGTTDYSTWSLVCCGSIISLLIMNSSVTAIFNTGYSSALIIVGYTLKNIVLNPSYEEIDR